MEKNISAKTGLDVLIEADFKDLRDTRVGLVCNQASLSRNYIHIIDVFYSAHKDGKLRLTALFGPQHGIWGHTQDNMIEWEGYVDPDFKIPIYSLYGEHRKPTPEMLKDIDVLVFDLQDVGARYYTFIWSMALCMEACQEAGIPLLILDRPNPINGVDVEGPVLEQEYDSFVGLYPLPVRHGMTIAEIAAYFKDCFFPKVNLSFSHIENWQRNAFYDDLHLPWGMPSPNVPVVNTAVVYPGLCLLEATNVSEGRGTTRPFEIFGAPWIQSRHLTERLNSFGLPGVYFRPLQFEPTFNKYQEEICQGCFIHVTDRNVFKPFLTGIAIVQVLLQDYSEHFQWKNPPYEYEYIKMPFDILAGNSWIRTRLQAGTGFQELEEQWLPQTHSFINKREKYLLY